MLTTWSSFDLYPELWWLVARMMLTCKTEWCWLVVWVVLMYSLNYVDLYSCSLSNVAARVEWTCSLNDVALQPQIDLNVDLYIVWVMLPWDVNLLHEWTYSPNDTDLKSDWCWLTAGVILTCSLSAFDLQAE